MTKKHRSKKCLHCDKPFMEKRGDSEAKWASRKFCGYLCLNRHKDHSWHPLLSDRFWVRVEKRASNECWPWIGKKKNKQARAVFYIRDGRWISASRFAWFLTYGISPNKDQVIRHTCDNPACVNPSHLLIGTQAENVADMWRRNRGRPAKGEKHPKAKLTAEKVVSIRNAYKNGGVILRIAKEHGVSWTAIKHIIDRRNWGHVP